jgi:large subunit ribosomal protein L16
MLVNFFNPPAKLKFKKFHKSSTFNVTTHYSFISSIFLNVSFLKSVTHGRLSINHLEAARKVIRRKMKKSGVLRAYVYPYVCTTRKALAVRMGKGKGAIDSWVFPVRPGRVLFEIYSAPTNLSSEALMMASKKLPIQTKVIVFN